MTFLSKLGSFIARGIAILSGLEPLIAPLFGSHAQQAANVTSTIANDLTSIGQIVVTAEAVLQTPGSGAAKLAAAAPLVTNIVKTSQLVSGHKIANEALFVQGCTDLTHAVAEILNALSPDNVNSSGQPLPPIPSPQTAPVPVSLMPPVQPAVPPTPAP